jgi:hypothetical protein
MSNPIRALGVVSVVVVAACVSGTAVTPRPATNASTAAPAVVAWVDRPAPPYVEPTPIPTTFPTNARPCRATDLSASSGGVGAAMGTTNIRVEFTNHSATACVLLGHPTIAGVSADGRATTLDVRHGSILGNQPWPAANIKPGETAAVNVSSSDACDAAQRGEHQAYPTLQIGLPSEDLVDVASHGFDTVCGVSVSRFGVPAHAEPPQEPTPSPLTVHISAPRTARAGEDFAYTVTLHNRAAIAYPLVPCPAYEEYVVLPGGVFVHPNYHLNCDTVVEIAARGSVTYEMHLQLAGDLDGTGTAKFGWRLQGEIGPGAAEPIQITS